MCMCVAGERGLGRTLTGRLASQGQGLHQKGVSLCLWGSKHTLEATEGGVVAESPTPERVYLADQQVCSHSRELRNYRVQAAALLVAPRPPHRLQHLSIQQDKALALDCAGRRY